MKLVIDKDLVQKCGGGSSEYWFSYNDCTVKNISEIQDLGRPDDIGQTAYFVSLGLIPFISISNEEIMSYKNPLHLFCFQIDRIESVFNSFSTDPRIDEYMIFI